MTPDEIRCMEKEHAIMIRGNQKPCKIKITPFFKQRIFDEFVKYSQSNKLDPKKESGEKAVDIRAEIKDSEPKSKKQRPKTSKMKPEEDELVMPDMSGF